MSDPTNTTCATDCGDSKCALTRMTEAEFTAATRNALQELLTRLTVGSARIESFQYDGIVLDKPGLRIQIGDAEFQLLIVKT